MKDFVLRGDLCFTPAPGELRTLAGGYLVVEDGKIVGAFEKLPARYAALPLTDYGDRLILPGMSDLHVHAAQYAFRGMYVDETLLDWLDLHAFPEETKFSDPAYAERAYRIYTDSLRRGATTRASIFASAHTEATKILMRQIAESGIGAYVGRVNMDIEAPNGLREPSAEYSAKETVRFLEETADLYPRVKPMLTPRFVLSCSRELMERLSAIEKKYRVPVQSHLSENRDEIRIVSERFPEYPTYGEVYDAYSMFGGEEKCVMAHCVYSTDRELALIRERGVFIALCPASNTNVITGIAPARRYLDLGLSVGLGSDVAGGHSDSMFHAVMDVIQASKLYFRYVDETKKPLTFNEAFYLATKGGGAFFGKVGSFEPGYECDAVVLDESPLPHPQDLSIRERLERSVCLGLDERGGVCAKYVSGEKIAL